jgi:hypothetical protein
MVPLNLALGLGMMDTPMNLVDVVRTQELLEGIGDERWPIVGQ